MGSTKKKHGPKERLLGELGDARQKELHLPIRTRPPWGSGTFHLLFIELPTRAPRTTKLGQFPERQRQRRVEAGEIAQKET